MTSANHWKKRFSASANPPEEERFSALLLDPVVKTEPEEPATYEDILASLEGPPVDTEGVAEPLASGSPEAEPVADHPTEETQDIPLDSEEVTEEVKEEPDFSLGAEPVDPASSEVPGGPNIPADEELQPPPTSPALVAEGAASSAPVAASEPVRVGHSPAGPSRPPRPRGVRGGKHVRTGETIRAWQRDFDLFSKWLRGETGGFNLRYIHHSEAHHELIWTIRTFRVLVNYCTPDQILVHFANLYTPYLNWTFANGYTFSEGVVRAREIACNTRLPDKEHVNLQVFGDQDPPRSVWDDYSGYRGPQPKASGPKPSVFVRNTSPEEPASATASGFGPDPIGEEQQEGEISSSQETFTQPTPARAKAKGKPKPGPKEPTHPPPGWTPSLSPADWSGREGAAPQRSTSSGKAKAAKPEAAAPAAPKAPKALKASAKPKPFGPETAATAWNRQLPAVPSFSPPAVPAPASPYPPPRVGPLSLVLRRVVQKIVQEQVRPPPLQFHHCQVIRLQLESNFKLLKKEVGRGLQDRKDWLLFLVP